MALPAIAEDQFDYLQITCSKELGYFALRTITLDRDTALVRGGCKTRDPADCEPMASVNARLHSENKLFTVGNLMKKPYQCNLPGQDVAVEIMNYSPAKINGECGTSENFGVSIKVNGQRIHGFDPYSDEKGRNRCLDRRVHLFEMTSYGAHDCTLPEVWFNKDDKPECKNINLPKQ